MASALIATSNQKFVRDFGYEHVLRRNFDIHLLQEFGVISAASLCFECREEGRTPGFVKGDSRFAVTRKRNEAISPSLALCKGLGPMQLRPFLFGHGLAAADRNADLATNVGETFPDVFGLPGQHIA